MNSSVCLYISMVVENYHKAMPIVSQIDIADVVFNAPYGFLGGK